jgi:hypothetical protein
VAPTENLGTRRKHIKRDDLEVVHLAGIQCICGPRATNAALWRGRGIAMEQ